MGCTRCRHCARWNNNRTGQLINNERRRMCKRKSLFWCPYTSSKFSIMKLFVFVFSSIRLDRLLILMLLLNLSHTHIFMFIIAVLILTCCCYCSDEKRKKTSIKITPHQSNALIVIFFHTYVLWAHLRIAAL